MLTLSVSTVASIWNSRRVRVSSEPMLGGSVDCAKLRYCLIRCSSSRWSNLPNARRSAFSSGPFGKVATPPASSKSDQQWLLE